MSETYKVLAPYVYVRVRTQGGVEVKGVYQDALLPEETLPESIEAHLRKQYGGRPMIERVGGPAPVAKSKPKSKPESAPVREPVEAPPAPAPAPELTPNPEPTPDPDPDPEPEQVEAPAAPPTTGPGSGKAAWVEYAVALGFLREEVTALGRDELISLTTEEAAD